MASTVPSPATSVPYLARPPGSFWEEPYEYHLGRFHPVRVGDVFNDGRYRIAGKLGHGAYCTVWLAEDTRYCIFSWILSPRDGRAVALKICAKDYAGAEQEIKICTYAKRQEALNNFVVELLDNFQHLGPNGVHVCLVFELMWSNVSFLLWPHKIWETRMKIVLAIIKQCIPLLQALEDHGIVHNGKSSGIL